MNCGSLDSFQVSWRCGWSPNAFQMRCTAVWLRPTSAAIERVDQCVASFGVVSSVLTITSSTLASLIFLGCPGRGSSVKPSKRCSAKRLRHLRTELTATPRSRAISLLFGPSAAASTIRDRNASACALVRRRSHASNCARSSAVNSIGTANGEGMTTPSPAPPELMHHDTSPSCRVSDQEVGNALDHAGDLGVVIILVLPVRGRITDVEPRLHLTMLDGVIDAGALKVVVDAGRLPRLAVGVRDRHLRLGRQL